MWPHQVPLQKKRGGFSHGGKFGSELASGDWMEKAVQLRSARRILPRTVYGWWYGRTSQVPNHAIRAWSICNMSWTANTLASYSRDYMAQKYVDAWSQPSLAEGNYSLRGPLLVPWYSGNRESSRNPCLIGVQGFECPNDTRSHVVGGCLPPSA